MPKLIFTAFLLLASISSSFCQSEEISFKVMTWNILHGARDIENGPQEAIKIIKSINPDIICMVETYGSGKMIADTLGYNFHLIAKEGTALDDVNVNLSIFSKFPFGDRIDTDYPFYLGGREVIIGGQKINVFSNWFHYLPWEDEPEKLGMTVNQLLEWERTETKYEMIQKVLPYLEKYAARTDSIPMIFAGDMNSLSHLDWAESTKDIHNGLLVPWYSTKVLADLGLVDSYRQMNRDPIASPGITWDSKGKKDEHRIDYIFYKGKKLRPTRSESFKTMLGEPMLIKSKMVQYPSDHGIVVTNFDLILDK